VNMVSAERPWEIYTLTDPRTLRARYVGITHHPKNRYGVHLATAKKGHSHRANWINSLLKLTLRPIYLTIEYGQGAGWQEREKFWITVHRKFCDLVNGTDGGDGALGRTPSAETRAKLADSKLGVPRPPHVIAAMRAASIGRHPSSETRAKMSTSGRGRVFSSEHRAKISAARTGIPRSAVTRARVSVNQPNRRTVLCLETGISFSSITDAAKSCSVHRRAITLAIEKGTRCKGNHFVFPKVGGA
jgi:hypothetical protein